MDMNWHLCLHLADLKAVFLNDTLEFIWKMLHLSVESRRRSDMPVRLMYV